MIRKDHCKVRGLARSTGSDYQYFCFSKRIYRGGGDDIERLPIEISLPETHKSGKNIKSYIRQKHEDHTRSPAKRTRAITGQRKPRKTRDKISRRQLRRARYELAPAAAQPARLPEAASA